MGFRELWGWYWDVGVSGEEWKLFATAPIPYSRHLFHLAVTELYPFIINW